MVCASGYFFLLLSLFLVCFSQAILQTSVRQVSKIFCNFACCSYWSAACVSWYASVSLWLVLRHEYSGRYLPLVSHARQCYCEYCCWSLWLNLIFAIWCILVCGLVLQNIVTPAPIQGIGVDVSRLAITSLPPVSVCADCCGTSYTCACLYRTSTHFKSCH